ncbi:unnamed protein product [Oncorhynchus mykiss]|uniref:Uncharacterized protein n=1 Tax=Oncorhynchus mykiss TaxID=8022 RepID=A0A060XC36_ONCMY|nr:unnamed protein product [Oncorhynchus mykiss]
MNLKLSVTSDIVSLQALSDLSEKDPAIFLVKGLAIGQTSVSAMLVDRTERKIVSAPQKIEVFPPFKLISRKMSDNQSNDPVSHVYQEWPTTQRTSNKLDTTVGSIGVNMGQHPCGTLSTPCRVHTPTN